MLVVSLLLVYWIYRELTRDRWAGELLKKPETRGKNTMLYVWLLLLFFWLYYGGELLRDVYRVSTESGIIPDDRITGLISQGVYCVFWLLLSTLNVLRARGQAEIRKKGFFVTEGFVPWENLLWTQWNEEGDLTLLYRPTLPNPIARQTERKWKVEIAEVESVQKLLETFAPKGVGQVLVDPEKKKKKR